MPDLTPIGETIIRDGMIFRVTGHGCNHIGQPAEIIEFAGIAETTKKGKVPKISTKKPVNLTGATASKSVGERLTPRRPARHKVPRKSEIVPRRVDHGPPLAGILIVVAFIIAILAMSVGADWQFHGPAKTTNQRK